MVDVGFVVVARSVAIFLIFSAAACTGEDGFSEFELGYVPGEEFPGGTSTNTLLFGSNAFSFPIENISDENEPLFFSGNGLFNQPWVQAPASTAARDGLGPIFNARSCAACHFKDGRGRPPLDGEDEFLSVLLRVSIEGQGPNGGPLPHPTYGGQIQPFSIPGVAIEGTPQLRHETIRGEFADGEAFALENPFYSVTAGSGGNLGNALLSARVAPAMIGLGLLQAVSEADLAAREDPNDDDGDGISGKANRVWSQKTGQMAIGRFGWKAEQPTVLEQVAAAFLGDIGITSSLFPTEECTSVQESCLGAQSGGSPEIDDERLDKVEKYSRLLAVPARQSFSSEDLLAGKSQFYKIGCAGCHTPSFVTGTSDIDELTNQTIWPYTDLLLHDLGPELSDGRKVFLAEGQEWRTPPLWGLRFYDEVNGHNRLLHDGRARGVSEAILWHGGEAAAAKAQFISLSKKQRNQLVKFVYSL